MLKFPGTLTATSFLARYWQKSPLFMPGAIRGAMHPAITRNELAWLATLDDVESRIVFCARANDHTRYRVKTGPFDPAYLAGLPALDWTLLVHDVEKHLPAMRRLFRHVPFIPDWRIDDLMISFAAPGGGVGPHRDNYDVFLFQGIGMRDWRYSKRNVDEDKTASDDLMLLREFRDGSHHATQAGDVLYLPPGVAHWGTAKKACMTYSIGMRCPSFYADPDLKPAEVRPGYISPGACARAGKHAAKLGPAVTELKDWLQPHTPTDEEIEALIQQPSELRTLRVHGMTRIAYDDTRLYVNGKHRIIEAEVRQFIGSLCERRKLNGALVDSLGKDILTWLLGQGAFELPGAI